MNQNIETSGIHQAWRIRDVTIPNRLVMAPMCNITHLPFRRLCKQMGAGLVATQMVSAKALTLGCAKTRKLLSFDPAERPIVFQVFGNQEHPLAEAATILQDLGADVVDLNMGCPAKKIVNDGGGSALLTTPALTERILTAMRARLKIPFTVKMRAGYDRYGDEALTLALMAQECGVDALCLHARTKKQGYSGQADWNLIRQFKQVLRIPVIGNGDVTSASEAHRMLTETGCDAVMIGRAAVTHPWIFRSCLGNQTGVPVGELKDLILSQYDAFFEFYGPVTGLKMMRKHLCAYTRGMSHGSEFRNEMVRLDDWETVQKRIQDFFDSSREPLLC